MVARRLLSPFAEGLYAAPEYLARHGTPQTPDDLARHRLIGYRYITANRILPLLLDDHGDTLSVEMATPLISNDIDVMADAIRAGIGIGRLFHLRATTRPRPFPPRTARLLANLSRRLPLSPAAGTKSAPRAGAD